jgi:murein DD-endopeptidase
MHSRSARTLVFVFALLLAGCATTQSRPEAEASYVRGELVTKTALEMVGRPYKYQGESPEGFDCSGLVRYSYRAVGLDLPHQTRALMRRARVVSTRELLKGDLLFFVESGRKYSHVGIYAGDDLFVHAASTGKTVRIDSLSDPYWKDHFLDARRL